MARDYAAVDRTLWGDSDFRTLTAGAQALYFKIATAPNLSWCGVVDFRPARLAALTAEQTTLDLLVAAQELADRWWLVIDQQTEEALVRGFLRHDRVMWQAHLAVSVAKSYATVVSAKIRAVIVAELRRLKKEHPELSAWEKAQVQGVLRQPAVDARDLETDLDWRLYGIAQAGGQPPAQAPSQAWHEALDGLTSDPGSGPGSAPLSTSTFTKHPSPAPFSIENPGKSPPSYPHPEAPDDG
ncbi:hypothetical protein [Gryllotalpicola protaetiae]|uniref:Uncharacterized protein n=1 Tax=Gryllotalpicola protaetiae TaxID=2419771 RepID=A0A387BVH1_9MICO|nr:hypothetical protein [Gryllotalpicola protaetiae]AYG02391.1 hypothetical protein D7I44_01800 [Gryllotalpicola protaetiae]